MFRSTSLFALGCLVPAFLLEIPSPASAHEDVTLLQDQQGKLITGISEVGTTDYTFPVRVFEGGFSATTFRSNHTK